MLFILTIFLPFHILVTMAVFVTLQIRFLYKVFTADCNSVLSVFQFITLSKEFCTFPLNHFRFHIHVTLVTVLSAGLAVFCFQQFTSRKYVLSLTRRQRKSEGCRSDLICFVSQCLLYSSYNSPLSITTDTE